MWTPSTIALVPSCAARSMIALTPTETAAVCSRNPTITVSCVRAGGSLRAASASNDDVYSVGISSWVSVDRMTSRTASVATTRTMFNRTASRVAIVDFPTPVAPPIITTRGTSSDRTSSHRRKFRA